MTNIEIIKKLKKSQFVDEDGETYTLDFDPGLTENELENLRKRFPSNKIADELLEILRETKGWEGYGLETTYFDSIGEFGFTELIPYSLSIGHDGFGNYWVLEIKNDGSLGKIYFACHDPAVLVIYCDSLNDFFKSLEEFYQNPANNSLIDVHENTVMEIWNSNPNTFDMSEFRKDNPELNSFLNEFTDDNWVVADLRRGRSKDGFAWGRFGSNQFTKRHPTELVWVMRKKRKGFFARLFGK